LLIACAAIFVLLRRRKHQRRHAALAVSEPFIWPIDHQKTIDKPLLYYDSHIGRPPLQTASSSEPFSSSRYRRKEPITRERSQTNLPALELSDNNRSPYPVNPLSSSVASRSLPISQILDLLLQRINRGRAEADRDVPPPAYIDRHQNLAYTESGSQRHL
jgi:hypothetical protein